MDASWLLSVRYSHFSHGSFSELLLPSGNFSGPGLQKDNTARPAQTPPLHHRIPTPLCETRLRARHHPPSDLNLSPCPFYDSRGTGSIKPALRLAHRSASS